MTTRWMAGLLFLIATHGAAIAQNSIYEITRVEWNAYSRVTAYGLAVSESDPNDETSGAIDHPAAGEIPSLLGYAAKAQLWGDSQQAVSQGLTRFLTNVHDYGFSPSNPEASTLLVQCLVDLDAYSSSLSNGIAGDLDVRAGASVTVHLQLFERARVEIDPHFGGVIGCYALRQRWLHQQPGNVGSANAGFRIDGLTGTWVSVFSQVSPLFGFEDQLNTFSPITLEPGEYTLTFSAGGEADVSGDTSIATEASATIPVRFTPVGPCIADFDETGFVDSDDFVAFIEAFGSGCIGAGQDVFGPNPVCLKSADVDGSGFLDADDFVEYTRLFGVGC